MKQTAKDKKQKESAFNSAKNEKDSLKDRTDSNSSPCEKEYQQLQSKEINEIGSNYSKDACKSLNLISLNFY